MKIATLTFNPAFDLHCEGNNFRIRQENFVKTVSFESGGKGVNVSRALESGNVAHRAIIVAGRENASDFKQKLSLGKTDCRFIEVDGRIRENLTVHDGASETRISFDGFVCSNSVIDRVKEELSDFGEGDVAALTGSLPLGISKQKAIDFCKDLKKRGVKLVLDSRSFDSEAVLDIRPWLIKPNESEAAIYLGKEIENTEAAVNGAEKLHRAGVENVVLSRGAKEVVAYIGDKKYVAFPPKILPVSTIGAGDSLVAGFIAGYFEGLDGSEILRKAVAFGTAACLTEGTVPPEREAIDDIMQKVIVKTV